MSSFMISILLGLGSVAAVIVFIFAIRVSYAIERVTHPRPKGALPVWTNMFSTAFARGVSDDDAETMANVRKLRRLLAIVFGWMLFMGLMSKWIA